MLPSRVPELHPGVLLPKTVLLESSIIETEGGVRWRGERERERERESGEQGEERAGKAGKDRLDEVIVAFRAGPCDAKFQSTILRAQSRVPRLLRIMLVCRKVEATLAADGVSLILSPREETALQVRPPYMRACVRASA
eukprot:6201845-Pleurochrysis_carterae.AAC.3